MKKYFIILFVLLLVPTLVFSQKWRDGRWLRNGSVDSDAYADGSIDDEHISATGVDGGNMLEATRWMWFGVPGDDSTGGAWALDGTNPPTVELFGTDGSCVMWTLGFDADGGSSGDDVAYLTFPCPDDYETDSMELYFYWLHLDDNGATTDSVEWVGAVNAVADGEDIMAAGTAMTAVYDMASAADSALYIVNLDPEVEAIVAGDLITIEISVDESDSQLDSGELAHLIGVKVTWEAKDE
jgi:hypothetical protein